MRDLHSIVQWLRPKPFAICLGAALSLAAPASKAESLKEALTAAYLFNPTLKAARAQLRSADNGVALAKSGYRPQILAVAAAGRADTRNRWQADPTLANDPLFSGTGPTTPRALEIAFRQNVFDGFRTYNAVKGAEAIVEAGREDLRGAEQGVLLNAATAYAHVVRDQTIVLLRQDAVRGFSRQLAAVKRRLQVGGISQTDVYQTQTALASAEADLSIARGTLDSSRAQFAQYIGHEPGTLQEPGPVIRLIPASLDQANTSAGSENPAILAAIFRERAQGHQIKQVKGQLLPSLSLDATYGKSAQESNPYLKYSEDSRVVGTLSVPLYEGGSVSAQIRGAIETQSQLREQIDEARERARERVYSAWGLYLAAQGNIAAGRRAVDAARLMLASIHGEEMLGQKATSDVLGAEQIYLNVRVALVSYRADLVVATYSILEAMGRLDAYSIALEAELYDSARYYGEVKDAWYGWGASVESQEDPRTAPKTSAGPWPWPALDASSSGSAAGESRQASRQARNDSSPERSDPVGNVPGGPERQALPASNIRKAQLSRPSQSRKVLRWRPFFAWKPEKDKPSRTASRGGGSRAMPGLRDGRSRLLVSDRENRAQCASAASINRQARRAPCLPAQARANTSWAPSLLPAVRTEAIPQDAPPARVRASASWAPSLLPAIRTEAAPQDAPRSGHDRDGQDGHASAQNLTVMSRSSLAAGRWPPNPLAANSGKVTSPEQSFSN